MSRGISQLVLVAACAGCLPGCGTGVGTSVDQAYAICYDADPTITRAAFDALERTIRFARDAGFTSAEVLGQLGAACEGEDVGCFQCLTALIDAVY